MKLEYGNMFSVLGATELFLVTTNSVVKSNKELVMGAGIAKELSRRFPKIPLEFGKKISVNGSTYGIILSREKVAHSNIGIFQVKHHYKDKAKIDLIKLSVSKLIVLATVCERIDLNFPGIGLGGLKVEKVLPLLEHLPNNIHIWRR